MVEGSYDFSYDPSTLVQGSDGRWYGLDPTGMAQVVANSSSDAQSKGLTAGANGAATQAIVSGDQSRQGGTDFWNQLKGLDWGSIAAGTGLVAGAGLGASALMGAPSAGAGIADAAGGAGWTSGYDLAGGAGMTVDPAAMAAAGGTGETLSTLAPEAAAAGGAAASAPSWLSALGPIAGIAAGANTLLNTPSGNGTGTGGIPSVGQSSATVAPGNLAAYQKLLGIDPSGMVAAGNTAGTQYADLAKQMQQYQAMMEAQAGNAAGAQTTLQGQGNKEFAAGNAMQTQGMDIMGNAQPLINAGNAIWNTAQDPQQALYQRTLQQIQDQSRASDAARGIGMSGESAGIENKATSNFNIDWQNQQLARMLSGATGMATDYNAAAGMYGAGTSAFGAGTGAINAGTGAYNAAGDYGKLFGADTSAAAGFGAQVPGFTLASGTVPFQTQQTAYGMPLQAGQDYASATNTAFNPNLANYSNTQQQFGANQSAAGMNALLTGIYGYNPNSPYAAMGAGGNTPGSWLTTAFGGSGGGGGGTSGAGGGTSSGSYSTFGQ